MEKSICVIAEDHAILREGLKALLGSQPHLEVVGEAEDGIQAIGCVQTYAPDIIILDYSLPKLDGLEALKEIKRMKPAIKIILLTVHGQEEFVMAALEAGADGYVLKDTDRTEILTAVDRVLKNERYIGSGVSRGMINRFFEGKKSFKPLSAWERLTRREREILKLIAEGYKNKEIAGNLGISRKTVEKHRANLMSKLDLHNVAALTSFAIEKGLVSE